MAWVGVSLAPAPHPLCAFARRWRQEKRRDFAIKCVGVGVGGPYSGSLTLCARRALCECAGACVRRLGGWVFTLCVGRRPRTREATRLSVRVGCAAILPMFRVQYLVWPQLLLERCVEEGQAGQRHRHAAVLDRRHVKVPRGERPVACEMCAAYIGAIK